MTFVGYKGMSIETSCCFLPCFPNVLSLFNSMYVLLQIAMMMDMMTRAIYIMTLMRTTKIQSLQIAMMMLKSLENQCMYKAFLVQIPVIMNRNHIIQINVNIKQNNPETVTKTNIKSTITITIIIA